MNVVDLYKRTAENMGKDVTLSGWIKNHRKQKNFRGAFFNSTRSSITAKITMLPWKVAVSTLKNRDSMYCSSLIECGEWSYTLFFTLHPSLFTPRSCR